MILLKYSLLLVSVVLLLFCVFVLAFLTTWHIIIHSFIQPAPGEGKHPTVVRWRHLVRPKCKERASLVAQRLKRLPAMRETWVRSLGREDPLEKEIATHSSTLARRIPWTEEPGGLQSTGLQRVGHD